MKEGFRVQGSGFILPRSRWKVDGGWWNRHLTFNVQRSTSNIQQCFARIEAPPPSTVHPPPSKRNAFRGFTLIEVTLAVVVIGMGLLAVFGLGQLALRNAKAMEDDTRSAMLAEDMFASLRTVSENLCASNSPSAWTQFWSDFAAGRTPLPLCLSTASSLRNQSDNNIWGNGNVCTNYLWSRPEIHGSVLSSMPEWSARFWMNVALTNQLDATGGTNLVRVTLHIAPGFSGALGESRDFYTHFAEHGTLP